MQQGTSEWLALRAGKFTGSRFADLMARTRSGPSTSRANLIVTLAVERLTGSCMETYQNAAMLRGIELEAEARAAYEARELVAVEEVAFIPHPTLPFVGVSPDGLVGESGMVEIKCPSASAKHYAALTSVAHADEYTWQLQGQLWVSLREWVDTVSYDPRFPDGLQMAVTRVYRDEDAIMALIDACLTAEDEVCAAVLQLREMQKAA